MTFVQRITAYQKFLCCTFIKVCSALLCVLFVSVAAYSQALPDERTYTLHLNDFNSFLNGVWKDVYQWDSGREATDNNGHTIGGWKSIVQDNLEFEHYTEYGGTWEGFCVSRRNFTYSRPDPLNQFTATTLGGKDGPGTPYMIAYYGIGANTENNCRITLRDGMPCGATGMYVTNTYYNYLSMTTGDGFARRFEQGDWFLLTAFGYDQNGNVTGTAEFYLADYRSENKQQHYIVQDWRWFDLSGLGAVTYLEFTLSSNDNAVYGMNTPAYFCMDQLTLSLISVKKEAESITMCPGASVTFHSEITGSDYYNTATGTNSPRIQWRKNGIDIPHANNHTYTIASVSAGDSGTYSCYAINLYQTERYRQIFKDPAYIADVLSADVRLSVLPAAPVITAQPVSVDAEIGANVSFHAGATGEHMIYEWVKDGAVFSSDSILSVQAVTSADKGIYQCVYTNGCGSVSTDPATLNVHISKQLYPNPNRMRQILTVKGYNGYTCTIAEVTGRVLETFVSDSDFYSYYCMLDIGAYLFIAVHPESGKTIELIVII
jgi:hypothetical protein